MRKWLAKQFGFSPTRPIYKRPEKRPRLEGLEERYCPAGPLAPVGNFWQPPGTNLLWSTDGNWSLNHRPRQNEQAIFDRNRTNGNKAVEADVTAAIDSMIFANGYSQVMTIDNAVKIETANGFNLGTGTANIDFATTTSKLQADGGNSQVNNFEFTGARGTVYIAGGTLAVGNSAISDTFSDFLIAGNLTVNNTAMAKFQAGSGITVATGGQMVQSNTQITSLWSPAANPGILENWGTFSFIGNRTSFPTEIDMPFLNHGSVTFDTGQLNIVNASAAINNYSLKMDGGSLTLKNGAALYVDQGYLQTGGLFSVADATEAFLGMNVNTANNAEFDGGNVQLGTAATFGRLTLQGGGLTFNGAEFDAKIDGQSNTRDEIVSDKTIHIKGTSKLVVTAIGVVAPSNVWAILETVGRTAVDGDFNSKSLSDKGRQPALRY